MKSCLNPKPPDSTRDHVQTVLLSLLVLVLAGAFWAMTREIDKPLFGPHAFRQTQTAISAFYMEKDPGMFLDYITPVLGKPWAIPMELPLFQWIVARWTNITSMPLDESGRLWSLLLWLACAWPLWSILRSLGLSRIAVASTLALVFSNPFYLFWGRAFLIESLALLLSLGMVALALHGLYKKPWFWLAGTLLIGCLAALVKVTTWAVAAGTCVLLLVWLVICSAGVLWKRGVLCTIAILLPLIPTKMWLAATEDAKRDNPFARELLLSESPQQKAWYYGTMEQKLSPQTWEQMRIYLDTQIFPWIPGGALLGLTVLLLSGAVANPRRAWILGIFVAGFLSGPIVFTNLYFEHTYYWFANAVWLALATGAALGFLDERLRGLHRALAWVLPVIVAVVVVAGFASWSAVYLSAIKKLPDRASVEAAWTVPIDRAVPENRALLIFGQDWNPLALYYAQRKGLAFPLGPRISLPGPQLNEALRALDGEIGGVVITSQMLEAADQGFWADFLTRSGMSTTGSETAFGVFFPANQ